MGKHGFDLVTGLVLVAVSFGVMGYYLAPKSTDGIVAKVYAGDTLVTAIDLNKEGAERTFVVRGIHDEDFTIAVRQGGIRVLKSDCPNQYCVREGWVEVANHPIVCAYNQVYIYLEGVSAVDVTV